MPKSERQKLKIFYTADYLMKETDANGAFNLTELARLCDISRTTAYKYIGLLEG